MEVGAKEGRGSKRCGHEGKESQVALTSAPPEPPQQQVVLMSTTSKTHKMITTMPLPNDPLTKLPLTPIPVAPPDSLKPSTQLLILLRMQQRILIMHVFGCVKSGPTLSSSIFFS
jgi:hypothetical protein